jgi:hypothetical protein
MNAWHDKIAELSRQHEDLKGELYAAAIRETRMKAQLASERQHNILEHSKQNIERRNKPSQ